ncbi:hypothetical protein CAPTEDRAFT_216160 [Capitella teleta]|uniref:Uncharacterized protein n=1 Tax=Capitella teleta TaxID=283909 RepID=R7UMG3_CAPTE|nr:hypothetical protein CAPTEDRAFT_216160 [Capitella teleta]|eukprot:ELU05107.1 hypothetical protein CAPTEDRAFT_216160 [Capitella teleta]
MKSMVDWLPWNSIRFHFTWTLLLFASLLLILLHQNKDRFVVSQRFNPSRASIILPPERACRFSANRSSLPWCSVRRFRDHIRAYRAFPECGKWRDDLLNYDIDFCDWKDFNLRLCVSSKGIKRIVVLGDSAGTRLYLALLRLIEGKRGTCTMDEYEYPRRSTTPNTTYFMNRLGWSDAQDFYTSRRQCATCRAQVHSCRFGHRRLVVEFLESYLFREKSLMVLLNEASPENKTGARSMQEFLFKVYFPKVGQPDLLLFLLPMHHEKLRIPDATKRDLNWFMDLVKKYKARKTALYLIPSAGEFMGKTSPMVWTPSKTFLPMDYLYARHAMLFPLLEPFLLDPDLKINGFINAVNMSKTRKDWSEDGIHFTNVWYDRLAQILASLFCA